MIGIRKIRNSLWFPSVKAHADEGLRYHIQRAFVAMPQTLGKAWLQDPSGVVASLSSPTCKEPKLVGVMPTQVRLLVSGLPKARSAVTIWELINPKLGGEQESSPESTPLRGGGDSNSDSRPAGPGVRPESPDSRGLELELPHSAALGGSR